ncbi:hypothetical protein [Nesterenkonia pannonica]|uniref:hypothetical protein n=1 Tax=Nesterenkonia pannonica TaxID=1548602 RepID=UPI0021645242|nr:hypothetical protein [Nesterenkonia pannonica]
MLSATERLARTCQLDPETDLRWRHPKVPELEILGIADDPADVLARRCRSALAERYPHAAYQELTDLNERLDMELGTIGAFGFSTYFLAVADTVDMIRDMGFAPRPEAPAPEAW